MNADFNNMQLGDYVMIASTVEVEDNAKLYTRGENQWIFITDFSGATGIRGETGLTPNIQIGTVTQGSSFNVTRTGTNENPVLNFTLVKGDKGERGIQGIQGLTGNGIASITKTGTSGLVDTYTITYTNGNTTTFTVTNGEDGEVTQTQFDKLKTQVNTLKEITSQMPQVSDSGEETYLADTIKAPFTEFEVKGHSEQESTTGKNFAFSEHINGLGFTVSELEGYVGDITIAIKPKTGTAQINYRIIYSDNTQTNNYICLKNVANDKWYTAIINQGKAISSIQLYWVSASDTTARTLEHAMVLKGKYTTIEDDDYEPYTGGQPAPSPIYPYPVKSCGDNVNEFDKETLEQGSFVFTTGDNVARDIVVRSGLIEIKPNTSYIISANEILGECAVSFYNNNRQILSGLSSGGNYNKKDYTVTTPSNAYYIRFRIGNRNYPKTVENDYKIKLEKGTAATPYSPYGMGCMNEKIESRNIFNPNGALIKTIYNFNTNNILSQSDNGDITIDDNNYIHGSSNNYVAIVCTYNFKNGKTIYCNGYKTGRSILVYKKSGELVGFTATNYTPSENFEGYLGIGLEANDVNVNGKYLMYSYEQDTPYIAHEEQTISIPTQQPMRSIGDVEDEFVKKNDGKWYERHWISRKILDGTENWLYIGGNVFYIDSIIDYEESTSNICLCSHYISMNNVSSGGAVQNGKCCFFVNHSNYRFYIRDINFTSVEDFKAYLAQKYANGTPVYLDYILQDPLDLPCTQLQSDILDSLTDTVHTYRGGTYISSEDEVKARIKVSGLRDLNVLFNN